MRGVVFDLASFAKFTYSNLQFCSTFAFHVCRDRLDDCQAAAVSTHEVDSNGRSFGRILFFSCVISIVCIHYSLHLRVLFSHGAQNRDRCAS